jgi:hypothetical protein
MARRSSQPAFTSTSLDAEVAQYRPFCGLAVVAAAVGVLSGVALLAPFLWILPALGVVLSAVALRQIAAADPTPVGRTAALAGLGLSLVFAAAAPTDFYYYQWHLRQEASQFGLLWFGYLTGEFDDRGINVGSGKGKPQPHMACHMMEPAASRQPLDAKLWAYYPSGSEERERLERFVGSRGVHALLLLGNRATVRYYDTDKQWTRNERDYVAQSFAVTLVSAEEEQETFFVRLIMERSRLGRQRQGFWRVVRPDGDILPVALGGRPPETGG